MTTTSTIEVDAPKPPPVFTGPRGRPLVGSLFDAWDNPLQLFAESAREHDHLVRFRFAWLDYYMLSEPTAAHRVLVENAKNYHKSPNYRGLKVMLGEGLLTSEGDHWKRQRKLAQPAFHRDRLAGFAEQMADCTSDMLGRWDRDLATASRPFDLHAEMMRLTFRIVGKTLLGSDLEADASDFGDALNVALGWANRYAESAVRIPPWVPTPNNLRFRAAQRTIEGVVGRVVAERHRSGEDGTDLLGMLMSARDENTGERMSDRHLMDELLTLTLAGHETTANALSFTFYLLSTNADARRRLCAEVTGVLGDRRPTLEDLPRLPLTRATVEEALRLYPPAWVVERIALEDDEVLGRRIPKGSIVGVSPYVMHRNPALWQSPESFDPSRFTSPDGRRHKLAYMPFGGGPRTCIGNAFAMMELCVIVPMILQRYALDLEPGFRLELDPSVTLRPKRGIPMNLRVVSPPVA